jgi:hypothetical protein
LRLDEELRRIPKRTSVPVLRRCNHCCILSHFSLHTKDADERAQLVLAKNRPVRQRTELQVPKRFTQEALVRNSKALHRALRETRMVLPSVESFEKRAHTPKNQPLEACEGEMGSIETASQRETCTNARGLSQP